MKTWLRLPAAIGLLLLSPLPAAAQSDLRMEPYRFRLADGSEIDAERGRFTVPEDRADPRSRRIEIGFVRFRSTSPAPGAPIVYLAGGPGGSGAGTARGPRQPIFLALRQVADVIALDQRGVGLSDAIPPCAAERPLDPSLPLGEATLTAYYRDTLRSCLERWRAAGVSPSGYTTEQSAEDIEDLRRALGAERIDLWAISYGTHLALALMRRHPGSVGRAAFASVEGLGQTVKRPASVDAAFTRIEGAAAPGLTALMRRVHARFDAEPQAFILPAGESGPVTVRADSFVLRMLAGFMAKNPDGIDGLAAAYRALDAGNPDPLAPLIHRFVYAEPLEMSGMAELMDIASGISDPRLAEFREQAGTALLGSALNFPMPQLRGEVTGLDLGDAFRTELAASHPVLLFSGDLDVRTPLEDQAEATAGLSGLHRILVRNGGHDLFEAHPDVPTILVDFFAGRPVTVTELSLPSPAGTP
ncbi:alpha/beta hydrolase [Sphingosinicella terrae]|uniref:alpha/beta hydrolase n=1 Tax=Sphingosinicella terrae TaxID=2172047 RepID=UPI000E0D707C|nr:alpha/beta hydrolase [Sphingosinicella terrae]